MINFRTTPAYEKAYAITNNLIKGRLSVAAKQQSQLYAIGKNNPAQTKLITRVAKFDAFTDYTLENIDSKTNGYKLVLKYFKNDIESYKKQIDIISQAEVVLGKFAISYWNFETFEQLQSLAKLFQTHYYYHSLQRRLLV